MGVLISTMPKDCESDDDLEIDGEIESTSYAKADEHQKAVQKATKEEQMTADMQSNQTAAVAADQEDIEEVVAQTDKTADKAEKTKDTTKKAEDDMPPAPSAFSFRSSCSIRDWP